MKALVMGGGSIGRRHLQNLRTLGIQELGLVEVDSSHRQRLATELHVLPLESAEEGFRWRPDFVVVATPTHLHAEHAIEAVKHRLPVLVEKPLSHTWDGLEQLSRMVTEQRLPSLVGCNMRFHPGPAKVKELLQAGVLGRLLFARVHTGSYLPGWRPQADYRLNYAARKETGGGCILDCIHEIDLARWYMGEVSSVFCCAAHLSSLEIATEDVAVLICRHSNHAMSEIHLDYVQRTYERGCQIVGERGSVFWDFNAKTVRWFDADSGEWKHFAQPEGWEVNRMYLDEMSHFIDCVREKRHTILPIEEAVGLMRIVFAAKESAELGSALQLEEVATK